MSASSHIIGDMDAHKTDIEYDVPAAAVSAFCGGGRIKKMYLPHDARAFADVYAHCGGGYVLGGGTNTLIADGDITTPVISTSRMKEIVTDGCYVRVGAGAGVSRIIAECRRHGLDALGFLTGVNASAGGIVRMNAGAFGHETAFYLHDIDILNADSGEICNIEVTPSDFGYRRGSAEIVLAAGFVFPRADGREALSRAREYAALRSYRQPRLPSLGSVFKNPDAEHGVYAARLIQECGLKGMRSGGAAISDIHANFIVNTGGGCASDYLALADSAREQVYKRFGITLNQEFRVLK